MSSSSKKKLRKEQKIASMTAKQNAAKKEAKQLKIYTATFWIVLALCVCLVAGLALKAPVVGTLRKVTNAVVVGDHKLTAVELNYFYIDAINNYCSQYSSYLSYFLDTSKPIDEQMYDEENKTTWADAFLDMALDSVKNNYALYDAAKAAGHKLTEDEQANYDSNLEQLKAVAKNYGYSSATGYLKAMYGNGASLSSYKKYFEVTYMASSYYAAYTEALSNDIDDADLREFEADIKHEYNSYTYASYYMNVDKFLKGGTTDEEGRTTYSDEEKKAAEDAAKVAADALAIPENNTVEALNAAIAAAEKAQMTTTATADEATTTSKCTENEDVLYTSINTAVQEWIRDEARQEGDIASLPYYTTSTDADGNETKTLKGYYIVIFQSSNDNTFALKDVRHILVSYEGGTTDENGSTTYSDEEKNAAKAKAEEILKQWEDGEKTEESFSALAKEKSTDTGSKDNGGLYEGVYPGQMVDPFENWCYDEANVAGTTGIVQTDYGYHVMYAVGDNETNYRDYMIKNDLLEKQISDWQTALNDAMNLVEKNTKFIDRDLVLNNGSSSSTEEDHEGHDHD